MKKVAVFTDLLRFQPAYSVSRGARNNLKMLIQAGYQPLLLMRRGRSPKCPETFFDLEFVELDYGRPGTNKVKISEESEGIIDSLYRQLQKALDGVEAVLTHDITYQANCWEAHVAARRLARERSDLKWLHWVHSISNLRTHEKVGAFSRELEGKFPNAKLVVMSDDTVNLMGAQLGYDLGEIAIIPHPIDFTEEFDPCAKIIVEQADLLAADIVAVYPCRLDRGKRPHFVIEVFAELQRKGFDTRVVIVDFHSTAGDKVDYRNEMVEQAEKLRVPTFFVSLMPEVLDGTGAEIHHKKKLGRALVYGIPHKAVLDLMEVADVLVQPSSAESYSRIVVEAAWKRCCLALNMDLLAFRQYDGHVLSCAFSSHGNHDDYMKQVAAGIAHMMQTNPILYMHAQMRKDRNLKTTWERWLWPLIEGDW